MSRPDRVDAAERAQVLRVAVGRLARRMRALYAEDGSGGPGFLEVAVLVRLARDGPVAPTAIANHEKVTSQAISPVLRALEGGGLVIRTPDPDDARKTVVTITEPGRSILQDREQAVIRGLIDALGTGFTDDEIRCLYAAVPVLTKLADIL